MPKDLLVVVYVRLDESNLDSGHSVTGVVSHWAIVESEDFDTMCPKGARSEFRKQLW